MHINEPILICIIKDIEFNLIFGVCFWLSGNGVEHVTGRLCFHYCFSHFSVGCMQIVVGFGVFSIGG